MLTSSAIYTAADKVLFFVSTSFICRTVFVLNVNGNDFVGVSVSAAHRAKAVRTNLPQLQCERQDAHLAGRRGLRKSVYPKSGAYTQDTGMSYFSYASHVWIILDDAYVNSEDLIVCITINLL